MSSIQPTVIVERPPAGLARGKWEAAPWIIVVVAVIAGCGALGSWLLRLRKSRKNSS